MKFIMARKIKMSQLYDEQGNVVPVTIVKAASGRVNQIKTAAKDGYDAAQLVFSLGSKNTSRPEKGKIRHPAARPLLKETRLSGAADLKLGDMIDISVFAPGDTVAVSGTSKGRGFAGVVKRHGFHGSPKTHGHKHDHRAPGSIGATDAQRVFPGRKMAGRFGGGNVTVKNLSIAKVDAKENLLYIKGALPGPRNGLLIIRGL